MITLRFNIQFIGCCLMCFASLLMADPIVIQNDQFDSNTSSINSFYSPFDQKPSTLPGVGLGGGFDGQDGHDGGGGGGSTSVPLVPILVACNFWNAITGFFCKGCGGSDDQDATYVMYTSPDGHFEGDGASGGAGGGAGGERPSGEDYDDLLSVPLSQLRELDRLMEQLNGTIVLVSDLDDTLIPRDGKENAAQAKLRRRFKAFVKKWQKANKLKFIIVTRASFGWVDHLKKDQYLPRPDYLISFLNYQAGILRIWARRKIGGLLFLENLWGVGLNDRYGAQIEYRGFIRNNLGDFLKKLKDRGLFYTWSVQNDDRLHSYRIELTPYQQTGADITLTEDNEETIKDMLYEIYGYLAEVSFNRNGRDFEISFPFSKGGLLGAMAELFSIRGATIVAAGDSYDNASMLISQDNSAFQVHTGIAVGNSDRDLKRRVAEDTSGKLYQSEGRYLAGVIEGLKHALEKLVN